MVICCLLGVCRTGLCIFGELDAKCQCVICDINFFVSKIYIWLCLQLLTNRTVLRVFWKAVSWITILSLVQIKFSISPLDWLLVNFSLTASIKKTRGNKCWWVWGYGCYLVAESCPTLLRCHGLYLARTLCPWNFPGKNTGVGCHFLLHGIFST